MTCMRWPAERRAEVGFTWKVERASSAQVVRRRRAGALRSEVIRTL
jgi:hypothetical protein